MAEYIDPTLLGIAAPMDLQRSTDLIPDPLPDERISEFPMKLRMQDHQPVQSIGLFGVRRNNGEGRLIRTHDGVDLLAPSGTPVFAVQDGIIRSVTVGSSGSSTILIEHTRGFRYVTFYSEIRNPQLIIYRRDDDDNIARDRDTGRPIRLSVFTGTAMVGQSVVQGDRIAETKEFSNDEDQLHFEIRYPFEQAGHNKASTTAVDPTWALYAWEKNRYLNNNTQAQVESGTRIDEFDEIVRGRMLRFLRIHTMDARRAYYFPLGHMDDADRSLVETLRLAFFHGKRVDLRWRDSLFFNQLEYRLGNEGKVPIIVEVKVLAN